VGPDVGDTGAFVTMGAGVNRTSKPDGEALGDVVDSDGEALGDMIGDCVGVVVGDNEGSFVDAHSVQHSQPCASQSTLRTSKSLNRQTSFGKSPFKLLFPNVRIFKLFKLARLSGTHPLNLLSLKANFAESRQRYNYVEQSERIIYNNRFQ